MSDYGVNPYPNPYDYGDYRNYSNPASPVNPLSPLSPLNPNGLYATDGDGGEDISATEGSTVVGALIGLIGGVVGGLALLNKAPLSASGASQALRVAGPVVAGTALLGAAGYSIG